MSVIQITSLIESTLWQAPSIVMSSGVFFFLNRFQVLKHLSYLWFLNFLIYSGFIDSLSLPFVILFTEFSGACLDLENFSVCVIKMKIQHQSWINLMLKEVISLSMFISVYDMVPHLPGIRSSCSKLIGGPLGP